MPLRAYGVFTGRIERRTRATSRTDHYLLRCSGGFEVSINAHSDVPPSDVEYAVVTVKRRALPAGWRAVRPGEGLDYVRGGTRRRPVAGRRPDRRNDRDPPALPVASVDDGRPHRPRALIERRPMPKPPLPEELEALLKEPHAAVIATLTPDGSPLSVATWYLYEDGRVLVNMDDTRKRLDHLRHDPRVSLTVLDQDWYRHVSLQGRVVALTPDADLRDIDRISEHYRGEPYRNRTSPRTSAWIEIDRWHAWGA
jgi:PPOX class probable F420-dependent enzyme